MLSIITPVLNGARFVEENIKSILSLSIPYEHIVVDGGSTDGTLEILSKYSHLRVLHQSDGMGMYSAIHQGIMLSSGEYLCYVNSDDKVLNDGYKKMYEAITSKNTDFVYSNGFFYFEDANTYCFVPGRPFGKFHLKNGLFPFLQSSSIFSKKIYDDVDGFQYKKFKICGDCDLFQRIAFRSKNDFIYLPVNSSIFLKYGESLGDRNILTSQIEKKSLYQDKSNTFVGLALFRFSKIISIILNLKNLLYHDNRLISSHSKSSLRFLLFDSHKIR